MGEGAARLPVRHPQTPTHEFEMIGAHSTAISPPVRRSNGYEPIVFAFLVGYQSCPAAQPKREFRRRPYSRIGKISHVRTIKHLLVEDLAGLGAKFLKRPSPTTLGEAL